MKKLLFTMTCVVAAACFGKVFDDDVIYNASDNSYYNNWLQIDYYMMKVVDIPHGMTIIVR